MPVARAQRHGVRADDSLASPRGLRIAGKGWADAVLRASAWGPAGHIQ